MKKLNICYDEYDTSRIYYSLVKKDNNNFEICNGFDETLIKFSYSALLLFLNGDITINGYGFFNYKDNSRDGYILLSKEDILNFLK